MMEKLEKLKQAQNEWLELNGYPERFRMFLDGYDEDEKTLDMNIEILQNVIDGTNKLNKIEKSKEDNQ